MFFDFMGNIYTLSVSVHPAELWGGRDKDKVRGGLPIPPKTRPTTGVVFNRVLLTIPSSASWLSVGANNALADWVSLFSHRYYEELPHKRKVGTPIQTNRERSGEDVENSGPLDVKFSIVHFYL